MHVTRLWWTLSFLIWFSSLFPLLDSSIFCHFIFTPSLLLRHRRPLLSITVLGKRSTGRVGHVSIIFLSQAFREKAQLSFHAALDFFFSFLFLENAINAVKCHYYSPAAFMGTPGHNWRSRGQNNSWIGETSVPALSFSWIGWWLHPLSLSSGTHSRPRLFTSCRRCSEWRL